ncbi:hypothetical protein VTJ49DRAFT_4248 [Mycothermus thermophilus]|uniref:FAD-binding domain-containing protein n=1 Tax=Humicola insolens TaxID=85995 RepID=A0ABR3VNM2_HUMIN
MTTTYDIDVLIVGAGPVGAALALELALHGVSFRIVDCLAERNDKSRSLVMQPRTLELLNRHGAADSMISRGRILSGGTNYIAGKLIGHLDFDDLGTTDTEFPLPLNVSQVETERFLDECLARYGVQVERPVVAFNIIQDATGVTTTLSHLTTGTTSTVRSRYTVGCDGAHSAVRHASDKMKFPGAPYPQSFVLCDARLVDSDLAQDRIMLFANKTNMLAVLPINHEYVRIIASERERDDTAANREAYGAVDTGVPTLEELQAYFTRMTPPGSGVLRDSIWLTRFRLHHRIVTQYRHGRLFVAGDAAHIHSPAGGQGMNAGIQDAINLGWKLATALALESSSTTATAPSPKRPPPFSSPSAAASAASALLDTYDLERRPVGQDLIRGTDRIFTFMAAAPAWFVPVRDAIIRHVIPRAVRSVERRRWLFSFISNLGITYRGRTRYVGEAKGLVGNRVRGGDRLVDGKVWAWEEGEGQGKGRTSLQRVCAGTAHHLLLFAAPGKVDKEKQAELQRAAEAVVDACWAEVEVHYVAAGTGGELVRRPRWYTDLEGTLHAKFGFPARSAGYVLVRPDGYVAHIGPLARLDTLLGFLEGYLVSADVKPARSGWSWLAPVAWVSAGLVAVKLLAGRFGWGLRRQA